jgi:hypothetical protein
VVVHFVTTINIVIDPLHYIEVRIVMCKVFGNILLVEKHRLYIAAIPISIFASAFLRIGTRLVACIPVFKLNLHHNWDPPKLLACGWFKNSTGIELGHFGTC